MDIEKLKTNVKKIKDPRRTIYGNLRHKLEDVIIGLLSLISMGEDFVDMEIFGKNRNVPPFCGQCLPH